MCDKHYRRWQRHGDADTRFRHRESGTPEERWWKKFTVTDAGCWEWTAGRSHQGYGIHSIGSGRTRYAHRFGYEMINGKLLEGLELDHLCRNRACVNPDHLEPVTHQVNVARGEAGINHSGKQFCIHGHEFTPENTYFPPRGGRSCRACQRAKIREFMRKKRAAQKAAAID